MRNTEIQTLKLLAYDVRKERDYYRQEVYRCNEELQELDAKIEELEYGKAD